MIPNLFGSIYYIKNTCKITDFMHHFCALHFVTLSYLSISELNSIESTESIEFVVNIFLVKIVFYKFYRFYRFYRIQFGKTQTIVNTTLA